MKSNTKQKLTKSNNRVFAGVLGGIAEYLNLVLMTIIPSKPDNTGFFEQMRQSTGTQAKPQAHGRKEIHNVHEEDDPRH